MKKSGERIYLNPLDEIVFEHIHRYHFASKFVKNKIVLDIACGSGYGTNYMANFAQKVYGLDIDNEVILDNISKFRRNNIQFFCGNATQLPFADKTFDIVVSFETIEHIDDYVSFLKEIKRVLKNEGILIISTPNKEFSDYHSHYNPYHIREFREEEFTSILKQYFSRTISFYQCSGYFDCLIPKNFSTFTIEMIDFDTEKLAEENIIETQNSLLFKKYLIYIATDDDIVSFPMNLSISNCNYVYEQKINLINKIYKSTNYKIGYYLTYPLKWIMHHLKVKNYPDL